MNIGLVKRTTSLIKFLSILWIQEFLKISLLGQLHVSTIKNLCVLNYRITTNGALNNVPWIFLFASQFVPNVVSSKSVDIKYLGKSGGILTVLSTAPNIELMATDEIKFVLRCHLMNQILNPSDESRIIYYTGSTIDANCIDVNTIDVKQLVSIQTSFFLNAVAPLCWIYDSNRNKVLNI